MGVSQVPSALQMRLAQSLGPSSQVFPGRHGGHWPPPQSTDVSRPFLMSSKHVAAVGRSVGAKVGDALGLKVGSGVGSCVAHKHPKQFAPKFSNTSHVSELSFSYHSSQFKPS